MASYNLSPELCDLLDLAREMLDTEIFLHRRTDVPTQGLLIDDYTFRTGKNVIAFSSSQLGMLKDFVIAKQCLILLARGIAAKNNRYRVLSFENSTALAGARQIYLDTLKDENTRKMEMWRKKQLIFELFLLFHETLSELPLTILANVVIAKQYPVMRNAQVYTLLKGSMRDMHDLVPVKDFIPQRYFVLHNGMFYARDMLLAYVMSEYKLNPVINIPELQRFRNLDVKEMMTHRWSRSIWYHTKVIGDAMSNILKLSINYDFERDLDPDYFLAVYECCADIVNRWLVMMAMQDWYTWDSADNLLATLKNRNDTENYVTDDLFGRE